MAEKSTFDNIWTKLGGRKLIAFVLGLAALMLLAYFDKLSDNALWGVLGLASLLTGGNAAEHIAAAWRSRAASFLGPTENKKDETEDETNDS